MPLNLDPLHRPLWRGRTNVDQITIAAIEYAESLRRQRGAEFVITQGSYQGGGGEPLSAGTHDLGGVVDLRWTGDDHDIWCLRKAGFAAWHRTPSQGPWPDHVHAVLVDHPRLAASAARQVEAYRAGRNGLASNDPDDGPQIRPIPVFEWPPPEDDMQLSDPIYPNREDSPTVGDVLRSLHKSRERTDARLKAALEGLGVLIQGEADDARRGQVRAVQRLVEEVKVALESPDPQ